jgi:hypothetical protein
MNYNNSLCRQGTDIIVLGAETVQRLHLFHWREYLDHIQTETGYDWLSVFKVAIEIYNGYLKGYAKVPDEKDLREKQLRGYL